MIGKSNRPDYDSRVSLMQEVVHHTVGAVRIECGDKTINVNILHGRICESYDYCTKISDKNKCHLPSIEDWMIIALNLKEINEKIQLIKHYEIEPGIYWTSDISSDGLPIVVTIDSNSIISTNVCSTTNQNYLMRCIFNEFKLKS